MRAAGLVLAALLAAFPSVFAFQQGPAQTPAFRSGVQLLEVDARVFDRDGRFVDTLTIDDFEIIEDGKRQTIQTMFLVGGSRAPGAPAGAAVDSSVPTVPRAPQTWIFFFDQHHMTLNGLHRARTAIVSFLDERFRPGDLAGIVFNDRMIDDRISSSRDEYMAAVAKIALPDAGAADADIAGMRATLGMTEPVPGSSMQTLQTLDTLARGLAAMPGPKTVVLLSDGFALSAQHLVRSAGTLRNVVGSFARAGARIYAIDTRGLAGAPDHGLNTLAVDTGGKVLFNLNNVGIGFDEIAADTNTYYVLGYQPQNAKYDGKYRRIEVRVKRPELIVRARKGYLALAPSMMLIPKQVR